MISDATPGAGRRFVHLHVHTEYSLLDGGNRVDKLVGRVKELGMDTVAVTDHGNLFGAMRFYMAAKSAGVKPIVGIEAYMAPGDRRDRTYTGGQSGGGHKDGGYHLLLLAMNREGYQNLLKLSTIAYTEGFYYKPRIDKEVLRAHSAGLVCTSACLAGEIPTALTMSDRKRAKEIAEEYLEIFGPERFYIELQKHIREQDQVNPELMDLAGRLGIGCVATNDVHFLRDVDHGMHDCLCCISTGKLVSDESRLKYPTQLYLKTPDEMFEAMDDPGWREACENTLRIASMCELQLDSGKNYAPVVKPVLPEGRFEYTGGDRTKWYTEFSARFALEPFDALNEADVSEDELKRRCDAALRDLCEAGLIWRYGTDGITPEIRERLDRELRILSDKSISAYFLIVWDFVNWARQQGIPANARGSGVGTMVGYVLGLSNACPVKYGLLFERFTDPDRSEYPDIDIDICQDGRPLVIDYVRRKYGHVAQIITFGTLKARAAIKDVGRVLGFSPSETQRLANMVPEELNITIERALEQEPDLRAEYDENPEVRRLLDMAKELEGHTRHSGIHAAGVVVATQPLDTIVPLCRPSGSGTLSDADAVTQWDGPTVEKVGLLKMDFLGLRTLSIIERCKQLIRDSLPEEAIRRALGINDPNRDPLDLELLTYDDPKVFELFQRGDTAGVFQFESGGMRNLLVEMKPDRLEDLIAANALYRPGPMDLIPDYNRRKHGQAPVPTVHPIVDKFTAETYGVMVYQEQVMQICHELGDIPLRRAYTLIKAISKKKKDVIDSERPGFVEGAIKKGLPRAKAEELFELILKFAGYGFNKSHSTGYAIVAYQTAYLKTYFPNQYMAAVLSYESKAQKVADWIVYLDDCKRARFPDGRVGIEVRPPDINLSDSDFSVVFDEGEPRDHLHGHVRFGLQALKGAGEKAIATIVEERRRNGPYRSLYEFCERVAGGAVNKATIEALIKAGAMDSLHGRANRAAMVAGIEPAVAAGQAIAADRAAGQGSLFGGGGFGDAPTAVEIERTAEPPLPRVKPWKTQEELAFEREVMGFSLSGHPLDPWARTIDALATAKVADVEKLANGAGVVVAGMLTRVRPTVVKNGASAGKKMAMITVEDPTGTIDGVLFSDEFAQYGEHLQNDAILFLVGEVDHSRGQPTIKVQQVIPIEQGPAELAGGLEIRVTEQADAETTLKHLAGVLSRHAKLNGRKGKPVPVMLHLHVDSRRITLEAGAFRVVASPELLGDVREVLGPDSCAIRGGGVPALRESRGARWRRN